MSLQVWLPFTDGTLKQQGVKNVSATAVGTVDLTDNGKLGKCVTFNGGGGITLPPSTMTSFTECSVVFWINITAWNTNWDTIFQAGLNSTPWNHYIFGILRNQGNYLCFTVSNGSNSTQGGYASSNLTVGEWIHLAFTYGNGKCKIYINGILDKEYSASITPKFTDITNIAIGRGTNGSSYQSKCKLNDFRIYDHCLSPMEVKQISQGLVLHYLLDNNSTYTSLINKTAEYTIYNNYGVVASLTATGDTYLNSPVRRLSMTPDSGHLSNFQTALHSHGVCNWTQTFTASTKYVFWIYYRPISHMDVRVGGTASNIGGWTEIKPKAVGNGWYVVGQYRDGSVTTDKTDNIFVSFYSPTAEANVPIQIDFACPTLVKGLTEIQPSINYNEENIIYDTSGFCYNGTINGNLSTSANTPRYLASTKFNGSEVITVPLTCGAISEALTVSCWGYEIDWNTPSAERLIGAATSSSGWCIGDYGSENTLFAFYANGSYNGATGFKQLSTGWHHFAITFDGLNLKYYVDGAEFNSRTFSSKQVVTGNYNINIGRHYGGGCYFKGNISDVRIYATALSAEDIQKLYSVSALIDSQGNTFASSYVEG